jgi:predicted PurR-regulated permease PerM
MSNETLTYVVAGGCGALALAAYVAFILLPAWQAYSRVWERLAAAFLTLYVVAAFVLLGVGGGAAIVWFYDRWAA